MTPTRLTEGFVHEAFVYESDPVFAGAMAPFLREGLRAGEGAMAVTTPANVALLREALGRRDAEQVEFVDAGSWYRRPATTIAAYRRALDEQLAAGAPRVRIVGEVEFGSSDPRRAEWTRYESLLNRVFAGAPAWIVCPYDARRLPGRIVADAERTHPVLRVKDGRGPATRYVEPEAFVRQVAVDGWPATDELLADIEARADLGELRRAVTAAAGGAGLSPVAASDLVTAVNEVATNALVHGGGSARVRVWRAPAGVACEIVDPGPGFDDPFAGFIPPEGRTAGGMGLWLARQLCDTLEVRREGEGFVVRLTKTPG